jgi:serine/threonine protein kinase
LATAFLGTGWLAEHRLTGMEVAVKVIPRCFLQDDDLLERLVQETTVSKQIDHPFLAKLFEVIETEDYCFLVQEYLAGGSLMDYITTHGRIPEDQARIYFGQLLSALDYLHRELMITHRDLTAENILLDHNMNIRLIDFGFSRQFFADDEEFITQCGSPSYVPPELVRGKPCSKSADIWSAGVVLFAMVTGHLPFRDETLDGVMRMIAFTDPDYPRDLSPQLVHLLRKMLTKSPKMRMTLDHIKTHPWVAQADVWTPAPKGVDLKIVQKIGRFGLDVTNLPRDIITGEYNEVTAVYFMLRRSDVTDSMCTRRRRGTTTNRTAGGGEDPQEQLGWPQDQRRYKDDSDGRRRIALPKELRSLLVTPIGHTKARKRPTRSSSCG